MTKQTQDDFRTASERVADCVKELHGRHGEVTREMVSKTMQLPLQTVDFHLKRLVNRGDIQRMRNGVYAPKTEYPQARAISTTVLPDGRTKIEVGDFLLDLIPSETAILSRLLCGFSLDKTLQKIG